MNAMLQQVVDIVKEASALMVADHFTVMQKDGVENLVTSSDLAVQHFLTGKLAALLPGCGFICEEEDFRVLASEDVWIIDPIDGTANYSRGIADCCISVALAHQGALQLGVVYSPRRGELYTAERGKGAWCNGHPIHVSGCDKLSSAVVATGFACLRAGLKKNNMPIIDRVFPIAQDIKRCGSAALDLCFVAAGRVDVYWEIALKEYDVAAGALIASEAGAVVLDMNGGSNWPSEGILCTNAPLVPVMLEHFEAAIGHVDPTPI